MSWIFKDESAPPLPPGAGRRRALFLIVPLALAGLVALVVLVHDGLTGGLNRQAAGKLFAIIIVSAGAIVFILGANARRASVGAAEQKTTGEQKPWLKREDWAAGRIVSSSRGALVVLWIFALVWCGISAFITIMVVPPEWHRGHHAVLIALLFPVIGLVLLAYCVRASLAWRRYGQSVFEMAAVPGALGGTLEGMIQLNTRLRPEHGLYMRLSCIRRTTTGTGKDRHTSEKILWQDEKWLRPDLPEPEGHTGIPVYFLPPADQPESTVGRGDGIHWQLEASARVPGPNFQARFEVPVFNVPGTPVPAEDPTASYQMSLDEIRQQIHSRIRTGDLPEGGREYVFPAARNPGFAFGLTVFWLIWTGVVVFLVWKHAPVLFPIVFGLFDLLMTMFAFDLWFRRSRVVVTPARATVQTSWLFIRTERQVATADIAGFYVQPGATAGHQTYYDLKIRRRDGRDLAAASCIAHKPEADWLVREMTAALGRQWLDQKIPRQLPATR